MTAVVEEVCGLLQACFSKCSMEELEAVFDEEKESMSVREESACGNEGGFLLCLMCAERVSEGCVESLKQDMDEQSPLLSALRSFVPCMNGGCC